MPLARRAVLLTAVVAVLVPSGAALAKPSRSAAPRPLAVGPNLVPNPSFEESALETGPVAPGSLPQPVLPTGWGFEGATVLFDHSVNAYRTGKRSAAISGALGGGRQFCDGSTGTYQCAPNPAYAQTHQADEALAPHYSVRPYWVTASPIAVTAGTRYRFSAYAIFPTLGTTNGVAGEGAATRIRWVDAGGNAVGMADGPQLIIGPKRLIGWQLISSDVVAPAGATGAVLMLGHTDYTTTSTQVAYDDLLFAALT